MDRVARSGNAGYTAAFSRGGRSRPEAPMDRLSSRDSRAFRNGLLAGLAVLGGSLAGVSAEALGTPAMCDASAADSSAIVRLLDRVTPEQPIARIGHRVTRADE